MNLSYGFVWLQTNDKMSTFSHVKVTNTKPKCYANLLSSATHVPIVFSRLIT